MPQIGQKFGIFCLPRKTFIFRQIQQFILKNVQSDFQTPFEIIQYTVQQSDNKGLVGSASARNGTLLLLYC